MKSDSCVTFVELYFFKGKKKSKKPTEVSVHNANEKNANFLESGLQIQFENPVLALSKSPDPLALYSKLQRVAESVFQLLAGFRNVSLVASFTCELMKPASSYFLSVF